MKTILFHKKFEKNLAKVSPKIRQQFFQRMKIFLIDPFYIQLKNHTVDARFPGCRSINVTGDYRAIFIETEKSITFVLLGTHSELYS